MCSLAPYEAAPAPPLSCWALSWFHRTRSFLSPFLLSELARVLRYKRMRKLHKLDDTQLDAYVQSLQSAGLVVNPPAGTATAVVSADPDDDPVDATAVAGQADVLCTRDHHLQSPAVRTYCSSAGIQVLTDIELLQILRASSSSA